MIDKYPRIANDDSQLTQFKNDVIAGEYGGSSVELAGNSLVVAEQERPEPIATFDGVNYYHKHEFNVEEMLIVENENKNYDLLSGEEVFSPFTRAILRVKHSYGPAGTQLSMQNTAGRDESLVTKQEDGTFYIVSTAVNKSYNIVESSTNPAYGLELPGCTAYYAFLSEDGKIFISYYNLKTDAVIPEYVDSIKQGNAVIPLKDNRVPNSAVTDAGKVVKVGVDGSYELGEDTKIEANGINEWIEFPQTINYSSTLQDLLEFASSIEIPIDGGEKHYDVKFLGSLTAGATTRGKADLIIRRYGAFIVDIKFEEWSNNGGTASRIDQHTLHCEKSSLQELNETSFSSYVKTDLSIIMPNIPSDASSKTYVLKLVNGALRWVEETA